MANVWPSVFKCIEVICDRKRTHQALGHVGPEQSEADHAPAEQVA